MLFRILSSFLPFCLTLWHTTRSEFWRAPKQTLSWQLSLTPSELLQKLTQELPFGSLLMRHHLLGAFFVALAAALVHQLSLQLLRQDRPSWQQDGKERLFNDFLAFAAAISACCSLAWIGEAAIGLSSCLGATLLLAFVECVRRGKLKQALPLLLALSFELPLLGALVCLVLFVFLKPSVCLPQLSKRSAFITLFISLGTLFCLDLFLAYGELYQWAEGPRSLLNINFQSWIDSHGFFWPSAALFYLADRKYRRRAFDETIIKSAALCCTFDLLLPFNESLSWLSAEAANSSRAALHLTALSLFLPLGINGLKRITQIIWDLQILGARPLVITIILFTSTSALARAEDTHQRLNQWRVYNFQRLAEHLFEHLPPRSIIIAESGPLIQFIQTNQKAGLRKDILLVATTELANTQRAVKLLKTEPALKKLVRDYSVQGHPTEEALDTLASVRTVAVTPESSWNRNLIEHLEPRGLLPVFSKHALGRSERRAAVHSLSRDLYPLVEVAESSSDLATLKVLKEATEALADTMSALPDRNAADELRHLFGESIESRSE